MDGFRRCTGTYKPFWMGVAESRERAADRVSVWVREDEMVMGLDMAVEELYERVRVVYERVVEKVLTVSEYLNSRTNSTGRDEDYADPAHAVLIQDASDPGMRRGDISRAHRPVTACGGWPRHVSG